MDPFLETILSKDLSIAELQRLKDETGKQLASSNSNSKFDLRYNMLQSILDYVNHKEKPVIDAAGAPVNDNSKYMASSAEHVVDHNISSETVDHIKSFIRCKLMSDRFETIEEVIVIEDLKEEEPIQCHVLPKMYVVNYYTNGPSKISIVRPNLDNDNARN